MHKIVPFFTITASLMLSIICSSVSASEVIFLNKPTKQSANLPFSKATQVGELLFLSGELGIAPSTGKLVPGGIKAETQQVMDNISATLNSFGSDLNHVAKCTVFLADIAEWPTFNDVYKAYFEENYPARSAMAASGLALGARVEVECIAVIKQ